MQAALDFGSYSLNNVAWAGLLGWAIERAKRSNLRAFEWISHETPLLVGTLSFLGAALTAAGMQMSWANADTGWSVTISGPGTIIAFLVDVARNLFFQEMGRGGVAMQAKQRELAERLEKLLGK